MRLLQASDDGDAERLDLEKRETARQETSARECSSFESERLNFERNREKRESRFFNRHSGPVIVATVGLISFAGTIISVREGARTQQAIAKQMAGTQKAIAEQTIGAQKATAEQAGRLQENRDSEDARFHRNSMMMQFIEKHSDELFGGKAEEADKAVKLMGTIPFLDPMEVSRFAQRLVALRPNTTGLADALNKTSQQLAQVPVMNGKVLVSDPLKHMWGPDENFAFLTTDDLDKPDFKNNFNPRIAGKGADARLKQGGKVSRNQGFGTTNLFGLTEESLG